MWTGAGEWWVSGCRRLVDCIDCSGTTCIIDWRSKHQHVLTLVSLHLCIWILLWRIHCRLQVILDWKLIIEKFVRIIERSSLPNYFNNKADWKQFLPFKTREHIYVDIREQIKHLSFIVDLMNNYEDFDKVYGEHKWLDRVLLIYSIPGQNYL